MVEKKLNHHLTVVLKRNCIWNVLLHVHYYNLLPSFKLVKEKDPKFVQDFTGAGRELNSLDSQSRKVFNSSGITGYIIVSLEHSVLE